MARKKRPLGPFSWENGCEHTRTVAVSGRPRQHGNRQTHAEDVDEPSKTERRARWESFQFRVPTEGAVRVENVSYGDESGEHVYVVSVESGIPFDCTCPAWKYHNPKGGCKHMIACENQPAVLMTASTSDDERQAVTDGGRVEDCRLCGRPLTQGSINLGE